MIRHERSSWRLLYLVPAAMAAALLLSSLPVQGQSQKVGPPGFITLQEVGVARSHPDDKGWEEFAARPSNPVFTFGQSGAEAMRGWIGHSDCARCPIGQSASQTLRMTGLQADRLYRLRIEFAHIASTEPFEARITEGRGGFARGGTFQAANPGPQSGRQGHWIIDVTAQSSTLAITLGNRRTEGRHYAYFDRIVLARKDETGLTAVAAPSVGVVAPPSPIRLISPTGGNDFTGAYHLQSIVHQLIITGDPNWATLGARWAEAMLGERNARDGNSEPYGWLDSSAGLRRPYVWAGFSGHNFAPILHLARVILANPVLVEREHNGTTLGAQARKWAAEFDRTLSVHLDRSLTRSGDQAWLTLPLDLPVANVRAPGAAYPPNMAATFFQATLHRACLHQLTGSAAAAAPLKALTAGFVRHLDKAVLEKIQIAGRPALTWNYAVYIPRREDVGHSNVVIRFLLDARRHGYPLSPQILPRLVTMADSLIDRDGNVASDLIDGTNYATRLARSIYYYFLLAEHSDSIHRKLEPLIQRSRNFAYLGAWLFATRPKALSEGCI
jgi:hypothetical protein